MCSVAFFLQNLPTHFFKRSNQPMQNVPTIGKRFYGLGIAGIGALQFVFPWFRPVLLPVPAEATKDLTIVVFLVGLALVIAGLYISILIGFRPRQVGILLASMLLIWLVVLHIPRALFAPMTDNGNETTSVFQCLVFAGMALLWSRKEHYQ